MALKKTSSRGNSATTARKMTLKGALTKLAQIQDQLPGINQVLKEQEAAWGMSPGRSTSRTSRTGTKTTGASTKSTRGGSKAQHAKAGRAGGRATARTRSSTQSGAHAAQG